MRVTQRWVETGLDGHPVEMWRLQFRSQEEQISLLRRMVRRYRSLHAISSLARDIVFRQHNCPEKRRGAHSLAVAGWVQRNIRYVNEGEETFQTPLATIRLEYGDCDDHTTLIASLLESMGIPCELVALGWTTERPLSFGRLVDGLWAKVFPRDRYCHIFPRAILPGGRRVPLDSTLDHPVEWLTDPLAVVRERGVWPRTLVL